MRTPRPTPSQLRRLLLVLAGPLALAACAGQAARPSPLMGEFELYETAPVETELGSEDLREAHEVWLEVIEGATRRIELAHFYASARPADWSGAEPDRLEPVIAALEAAADRGVAVRFLAEDGFYDTYPETLDRLDARQRIEVRRVDFDARGGGVLHAKFLVADGAQVCVGSHNFDWRSLSHIQELGARVRSAAVASSFLAVFDLDWKYAGGVAASLEPDATPPRLPVLLHSDHLGPVEVLPVFSPAETLPIGAQWDWPHIQGLIDGAQNQITLALLTFRPVGRDGERFQALSEALQRAVDRGVRVRLMVADWGKRPGTVEELQRLAGLDGYEIRFVHLPEAEAGFIPFGRCIHSKFLVADSSAAWLGTSNFERSYFEQGRNAGLILRGAGVSRRLNGFFEDTWNSSLAELVDPAATYSVPRIGN